MSRNTPLRVEVDASPGAPPVNLARLEELLRFAARLERGGGEVAIWLCTDAEIADLHLRFMGIPGATDVMSFPGDAAVASVGHLGDIAISFETAARQGKEAGNTVAREVAYLALHGVLHLLGYDDLDAPDRSRMIARQDELLAAFEESDPGDWG
ncbi:MAG TPA: rRNA maturation RNase YbeY [Thermomicrobiaceae bacterium]|nr:rRNA maturation RNase YbeY [Thermomicrobiaceae bacterium]